MGGQQSALPLEPHDTERPEPEIGIGQFRAQFTEEMRHEIAEGLHALHMQRRAAIMAAEGLDQDAAGQKAFEAGAVGRRALQLLGAVWPAPYGW